MRWKLTTAACLLLAAPALGAAVAADRPQPTQAAHSEDRKASSKATAETAERGTERGRSRTAMGGAVTRGNRDVEREHEEHDHERDDD